MSSIDRVAHGRTLKRLQAYFAVLILFWGFSLYWWLSLGYSGTFVWMNQIRWEWLDNADLYFFTHLGDGLILPALVVLLFWRRDPGLATTAVIAILVCGLIAVLGKAMVFSDWDRPARVFQGFPSVQIVHPDPPKSRAFPSGHATVMAAGGVYFAWFLGRFNRFFPAVVGLFTVFLCFTRVVIGVHFPADIFVGSMIGAVGGFLFLWLLYPRMHTLLNRLRGGRFPMVSAWLLVAMGLLLILQFVQLVKNT